MVQSTAIVATTVNKSLSVGCHDADTIIMEDFDHWDGIVDPVQPVFLHSCWDYLRMADARVSCSSVNCSGCSTARKVLYNSDPLTAYSISLGKSFVHLNFTILSFFGSFSVYLWLLSSEPLSTFFNW